MSHKKRLPRLFLIPITIVVIIGMFLVLKRNPVRTVSAKEYIEQTSDDLHSVAGKIHYYQNGFAKVDKLFGDVQTAFYEITTKRTYFESKKDTAQDIRDITGLLHQIDQLQDKRKMLKPPAELDPLVRDLDAYYSTIYSALEKLLVHE